MQLLKAPGGKGGKEGSGTGGGSGRFGVPVDCAVGPVVWVVKATAIIVATARIAVFPLIDALEVADFTTALRCVLIALATQANQFQ